MRKQTLLMLIAPILIISCGLFDRNILSEEIQSSIPEIIPTAETIPSPSSRDVFKSGLIPSQQHLPDEMQDATTYTISLNIADDLVRINGHQEVLYTNQENVALSEIYFHLMPNYLGEQMLVSNLSLNEKDAPFELEMEDTVMHIPLETALQPNESITIAMDFLTVVPTQLESNYGILAYVDGVLAFAHGYPMLAVYDDEGWNIAIPDEQGDVSYLDASFYLVQVNAPKDLVLVGSGNETQRTVEGDRQSVTFAAGPARDFYLAASEDYVKTSQDFGDYTVNSYAPANLAQGSQMALDVAAAALALFSERYAPYSYTEFDIVATPTYALGIEYPGMTAINAVLYALDENLHDVPNSIYLESTIAHEVGHHWFYNMVGNDQLDEPWLDESLVQYITWQYYLDQYGTRGAAGFEDALYQRWGNVDMEAVPLGQPVQEYEGNEYGSIIYGRGAFFFEALDEKMGAENFAEFMRIYTQSHAWGIATTASIRESAENSCECDLGELFNAWVY